MRSAPSTASATFLAKVMPPSLGRPSGSMVRSARRAPSSTSPTLRSASGSGSKTATSMPLSTRRAIHPAPMTPQPMAAAFLTPAIGSPALLELELFADFLRPQNPAAHAFRDLDRPFRQGAVGGKHALVEPDIVFQPDADIAAGERGQGRIGQLIAADGKGREHPVG